MASGTQLALNAQAIRTASANLNQPTEECMRYKLPRWTRATVIIKEPWVPSLAIGGCPRGRGAAVQNVDGGEGSKLTRGAAKDGVTDEPRGSHWGSRQSQTGIYDLNTSA